MGVDADDFPAARTAFGAAWHRLLAAIHATRDPQQRFDRATETGEQVAKLRNEAATERADAALGIKDAEDLSLTALGDRISTTKQGAWRLTSKARKEQR
jgi:hypothetical protein